MENLPIEILQIEIGKYLDLSGLISMSFVNRSMMDIFHPHIKKIVLKIDPFAQDFSIYDMLHFMRVGTTENVIFKIYKQTMNQILNEMKIIFPYIHEDRIISTFVQVVPQDAISDLKQKMKRCIVESKNFFIYRNVVYRNYLVKANLDLNANFESDLTDIIDPLVHELTYLDHETETERLNRHGNREPNGTEGNGTEDTMSVITDSEIIDYFPYDTIIESIDAWMQTL